MGIEAQNKWRELHCESRTCRSVIGFTNTIAAIYGGIFIQQPKTNLLCMKCGRIKIFRSSSDDKIIRFLTDGEAQEIIKDGLDYK